MTEKRLLIGNAARCGKTICLKKVKALAKELSLDYGYYTDNQAKKRNEELFKHKPLNCSDRIFR